MIKYENEVKTMSYSAKILKPKGNIKAGDIVTVTRNRDKEWVLEDGRIVKRGNLILRSQIYNNTVRYKRAVAEDWINSQKFSSATEWLFWANKYGQRAYIFRGKKGNWKLKKVFKCSTGMMGFDQGVGFSWRIWDKCKRFPGPRGGIQMYNQHYSSAGGNSIHQGRVGKPSTHGCIALNHEAAVWVFENIPIGSRVVVF